jgi:hypothetical protein
MPQKVVPQITYLVSNCCKYETKYIFLHVVSLNSDGENILLVLSNYTIESISDMSHVASLNIQTFNRRMQLNMHWTGIH